MASIDYQELFNIYYQNEYDFNTAALSEVELEEIRQLVKEKRTEYALAPMGTGIFSWIQEKNSDIRYEMVLFDSEKIDGMLYIPTRRRECAYIVLNANKPLINQVFTAAHEYYHYIKDYQRLREEPYVCDLSHLKNINEKSASRFAAELLLPREALFNEVKVFLRDFRINDAKNMDFFQCAALIMFLTVKYQMPLKAVIYRFAEEKYIEDIDQYIANYEFMKDVLQEAKISQSQVNELYGTENRYIVPYRSIYSDMKKAFLAGNATREEIIVDAEKLGLEMELIYDFLETEDDKETRGEDTDEDLFKMIHSNWGKNRK